MAVTTFEAEQASNSPGLIWKALGGIIYTAPTSQAIPATFTTSATADLDGSAFTGFKKLGLITKGDGITFSRDFNTATEESWGYNEPTRTDVTSDVVSAQFTLMEAKRSVLELVDFVDMTAVVPDVTTGETSYNKPVLSAPNYCRMIFLGVDGVGTSRRYRIKIMPRAQVVAVADESWQSAASTKFQITVRASVDTVLGYAVRNVLAGPGQKSQATAFQA